MMLPKKKKLCSGTLPPDVLSNIPENLLDEVLIRLPLRDAVRTSILSKKWRYSWCRLPVLTLDKALWDKTNRYIPLATRFTDIIYHLLALHVGPITKFTLSIASMENYLKIDYLISFLSRNGIQHLVLQFPMDNPYKLPYSFFTCLQMRHLKLHNCSIQLPPTFKGFNELVSLELYEVKISFEMLECLISWSLLLEKLVLQIPSTCDLVQINAPKLKYFDFTGDLESIFLNNVPFLVKLSLVDTIGPSLMSELPDLADYFESCPSLEHLHLSYSCVQLLAVGSCDMAMRLSSPLNCLKCLCLSDICLDAIGGLSCALCLIRSTPYLQDIQMKIGYGDTFFKPVPDDAVSRIPATFSDVTWYHLRSVKLEGITGKKPEMELVKLLLAKSPMLERMLIQPKIGNVSAETRLKVLAEITKFPRASPKAQVDYNI